MSREQQAQPPGGAARSGEDDPPGPALAAPATGRASWQAGVRTARRLAWMSLGWMAAEGALGLAAGVRAGQSR